MHTSTRKAPFKIIEGRPKIPLIVKMLEKVFATDEYSQDLKESFQKIKDSIFIPHKRQNVVANKHRKHLVFKENNWVLLKFSKACLRHTNNKGTNERPTSH